MRVIARAITSGAALALMTSAASAQQQFNGFWSVEVIPQRGNCQQTYRFPVLIQNGQIRYGGAEGIAVSGGVTARGVIRGSVGTGAVQASVVGRLRGRSGSGTWATAGSLNCSGPWRAIKSA
jgi:hypothetical protein